MLGPAVVEGGIQAYWIQHIAEFSNSTEPLIKLFPQGAFALHGNSKIFGAIGIACAMYMTSKPENKKKVAGLLIPAVLTAVLVGITEPLEFTFLFVAPFLFAIHAVLAATMAAVMYMNGIVGNMGGGLLEIMVQNWLPMFHNHAMNVVMQIMIGSVFTVIYFFVFKYLIVRFDVKTPGREADSEDIKLFTKADYKNRQGAQGEDNKGSQFDDQALQLLEALGGSENIAEVNNCATRLRISVKDEKQVMSDAVFRQIGAHGVVRNKDAIQVIIGLSVPQVRDSMENLMKNA